MPAKRLESQGPPAQIALRDSGRDRRRRHANDKPTQPLLGADSAPTAASESRPPPPAPPPPTARTTRRQRPRHPLPPSPTPQPHPSLKPAARRLTIPILVVVSVIPISHAIAFIVVFCERGRGGAVGQARVLQRCRDRQGRRAGRAPGLAEVAQRARRASWPGVRLGAVCIAEAASCRWQAQAAAAVAGDGWSLPLACGGGRRFRGHTMLGSQPTLRARHQVYM